MQAAHDNIIIKPIPTKTSTLTLINQQSSNVADVVSIGSWVEDIKVGDRIIYQNPIKIGSVLVVKQSDVLCVFT
ncbi:MAG: hypothetical protein Q4F57_07940 [Weeksellaceae bacterium]|nr:hypothetical protein [Weeksellaceae bacterium]